MKTANSMNYVWGVKLIASRMWASQDVTHGKNFFDRRFSPFQYYWLVLKKQNLYADTYLWFLFRLIMKDMLDVFSEPPIFQHGILWKLEAHLMTSYDL